MAFAQILIDLATHSTYVCAMREEVQAVIDAEGLSKSSLLKMRKVDSFIKESLRLGSSEVCKSAMLLLLFRR